MPLVEVEGKLPAASVREKAKEKAELGTRIASRLSLVRITIRGLEKSSIYAGCSHWQCCKSDEIVPFDSHIGINPSFPL